MITRSEMVMEARRWVGTPHRPRVGVVGQGADCIFLQHAIRNLVPSFPIRRDYPLMPKNREIERELDAKLDVVFDATHRRLMFKDLKPARIALFAFTPDEPQHIGLIFDHDRLNTAKCIVHCTGNYRRDGAVVEHTLCTTETFERGGEVRSPMGKLVKLYDVKGIVDG